MYIKTLKLFFGLWVVFQLTGSPQAVITLEYSGISNDSIDILIRGENLSAIGAITLKINYDPQVLGWGRLITEANGLSGSLGGVNGSVLTIAWDNLSGYTAANEIMYRIRFKYYGGPIEIYFNTAMCELADISGNTVNALYNNLLYSSFREESEATYLNSLRIYPNPASEEINLDFSLSKSGWAEIAINNINGKTVKNISRYYFNSGNHRVKISNLSEDLSAGLYIVRFETIKKTFYKKFLLIK